MSTGSIGAAISLGHLFFFFQLHLWSSGALDAPSLEAKCWHQRLDVSSQQSWRLVNEHNEDFHGNQNQKWTSIRRHWLRLDKDSFFSYQTSHAIDDWVPVLELQSSIGSIFLINCYLPFFKANDGAAQSDKYMETIGFIDSIIDRNPDSHFVLMGDMNTNFYNGMNEFSTILKNFISERDFYCVFDSMDAFDASTCYTRSNLKQGSFTLLDYIFVSSSLTKFIVDVNIIDSGEILSDHLPIWLSLLLELSTTHTYNKSPPPVVNWRNMSMEYRQNYEQIMEVNLDRIRIPHIVHGDTICDSIDHLHEIENYYNEILRCLYLSDLQLPRCTPTTRKR